MRTFDELKQAVMSGLPTPVRPPSDEEVESAINGAIASVHGEMFAPLAPATVTVTTGTNEYNVPASLAYIDEVRDSSGNRIADYAWELGMGTTPTVHFRPPYFTPTTGENPKVYGGQVQAALSAGTDDLKIDPGYVIYRATATLCGSLGLTDPGFGAVAEARLADETIMAKFRPKPWARIVPGRIG